MRELGNIVALTWETFKEEFGNQFFLEMIKHQKVQEFMTLVQGNSTLEQYAARFMEPKR